ncbi:hypothetical protein BU14_1050s0001 [Porphyra umbilicalis]|uniref:Uncharacterized protein n=1 Tax=Porphyra umbilicalis TaxID=2786 RepID=A0A1X6NMQ1_PORUM|nr:hypothetical protein BU14_1050s0001 [Porphyra umbilicalis]|eukprot:OSX69867.1 hypothetical protein BU14_1050s0001 [Porphyra umbilicalis]
MSCTRRFRSASRGRFRGSHGGLVLAPPSAPPPRRCATPTRPRRHLAARAFASGRANRAGAGGRPPTRPPPRPARPQPTGGRRATPRPHWHGGLPRQARRRQELPRDGVAGAAAADRRRSRDPARPARRAPLPARRRRRRDACVRPREMPMRRHGAVLLPAVRGAVRRFAGGGAGGGRERGGGEGGSRFGCRCPPRAVARGPARARRRPRCIRGGGCYKAPASGSMVGRSIVTQTSTVSAVTRLLAPDAAGTHISIPPPIVAVTVRLQWACPYWAS